LRYAIVEGHSAFYQLDGRHVVARLQYVDEAAVKIICDRISRRGDGGETAGRRRGDGGATLRR